MFQALFERLMLDSPADHVITTGGHMPDPESAAVAAESNVLRYLYQSYIRLLRLKKSQVNNSGCQG